MLKHVFSSPILFFHLLSDLFLLSYQGKFCEHLASPSKATGAIKTIHSSPRQNAVPFSDLQDPSHTSAYHLRSCGFPAQGHALLQAFKNRASLCEPLVKTSPVSSNQAGMKKSNQSKWVFLNLQRKIVLRYQSHPSSVDSAFHRSSCAAKEKSPAI